MRRTIRSAIMAGLFATLGVTTGCSTELLGGAQDGTVRTEATSSPGSGSASGHVAPEGRSGVRFATLAADGSLVTGTVTFRHTVTLVAANGDEVRVSPERASAVVRIEGTDTTLVAETEVAAREFVTARVEFTEVRADVRAGLPFSGLVTVQLGAGGRVVVERPISLRVRADGRHRLVVDLHAESWLRRAVLGVVTAADFAGAVTVGVR